MRNLVRSCSTADDLCLFGIYSEPEVVEAAFERGWPGRTLGIPPRCMFLRVTAHMWWGTITHCFDRVIEGLAYFGCEQHRAVGAVLSHSVGLGDFDFLPFDVEVASRSRRRGASQEAAPPMRFWA